MQNFKISNEKIIEDLIGEVVSFPKYTTQIINLANQNAQGTRPKVVGQMSELIQECPKKGYDDWVEWYITQKPHAIEDATEKIYQMIEKLKIAIKLIDKNLVSVWAKDLVLTKTFMGFCFQESILKRIADLKKTTYRQATPNEESKGIDGYVGEIPVSVKPITYKTMDMLSEEINVQIIFYEKKKDGIKIEFNF